MESYVNNNTDQINYKIKSRLEKEAMKQLIRASLEIVP